MQGPTPVWTARTGATPDAAFMAYSESTAEDSALVQHDIAGSVAHVIGLHAAGLIEREQAITIIGGLQAIAADHAAGALQLDPALEDVHMNVEHQLGERIGDVAARLHTGRSRNDQVALTTVLYAREALAATAAGCLETASTLAEQAAAHADIPWVARTHGVPAQPATLGFLLAAHAERFQGLAQRCLEVFHRTDASPLGSGAVAGSTLPLEPTAAAEALGLRPPTNAILATSSRDAVVEYCQIAASVGSATAACSEDLLQIARDGAATFPTEFTTGSSLMPHKRNPDALELVRGNGRGLAGPAAAVAGITVGLPLGYHRDLQLVKPQLITAATTTIDTLGILAAVIDGTEFDADVLAAGLQAPGIGTTDAAEALVRNGVPFRVAYTAMAKALAADDATSIGQSLTDQGMPADAVADAVAALEPDPARRSTPGGPAPSAVQAALAKLATTQDVLAEAVSDAQEAAATPFQLLSTDPTQLIDPPTEDT